MSANGLFTIKSMSAPTFPAPPLRLKNSNHLRPRKTEDRTRFIFLFFQIVVVSLYVVYVYFRFLFLPPKMKKKTTYYQIFQQRCII